MIPAVTNAVQNLIFSNLEAGNLMKHQTFMQQYREWQRSGSRIKASRDRYCLDWYGRNRARDLDRYEAICCAVTHCNVHTRINFRAAAAAELGADEWQRRSPELNKYWRSWEC